MSKIKENPVKDFNAKTIEFFEYVLRICPNEGVRKDIFKYKGLANTMMKINSRKIIDGFAYYVAPHKKQICDKDDNYFLGLNLANEQGVTEYSMMESLRIKEIWSDLTADQKEMIFNYVLILISFTEKYIVNKFASST